MCVSIKKKYKSKNVFILMKIQTLCVYTSQYKNASLGALPAPVVPINIHKHEKKKKQWGYRNK